MMHVHRKHPLRRHDDLSPQKLTRSLIFITITLLLATSALLLVTAVMETLQ